MRAWQKRQTDKTLPKNREPRGQTTEMMPDRRCLNKEPGGPQRLREFSKSIIDTMHTNAYYDENALESRDG